MRALAISCYLSTAILGGAQLITTTWADQSIIGLVTSDGAGYTWTAVISTLGPAVPETLAAAAATTPVQAAAAEPPAPTSTTTAWNSAYYYQSMPSPPPAGTPTVTVVPTSGHVAGFGEYESSLLHALGNLGTEAVKGFTSAVGAEGIPVPHFHFGAARHSAPISMTGLLSALVVLGLIPIWISSISL
ncbi:hypothetical protein BD324DRAFT_632799 [Kockovaella imperatae]|uniref:Uncharacterized protein n=1 Tax=Kockovaella imperatae TaxID=4999 RepID=A0A1Y1UD08_9TREE|nr:hypothetical protein BD324DRAFT_632799 [Kockovaella imperatae]ORX35427.1 hypothetical protein BD324DRAFT_632799 [Kockovaella imperatae]